MARKFDAFAEMMLNKCTRLRDKGKHKESLVCMTNLTEKMPKLALAWYHHGLSLHLLGKYKEAIDSYSQAIKLDEKDWVSISSRALMKFLTQDFEGAKKDVQKSLKINPKDVSTLVLGAFCGAVKGDEVVIESYLKKASEIDTEATLELYSLFAKGLAKKIKIPQAEKKKLNDAINKLSISLRKLKQANKKLEQSKKK